MADRFVEVSHQGYLSRLGSSCAGVVVGLALVVGAPVLLFWNEGRTVHRAGDLAHAREVMVEADAGKIDPALEGKLVHVTGQATTHEVLRDPEFNVSVNAVRLVREVEMFQWKEDKRTRTSKNLGGSETKETTYEYQTVWDDDLHDSSGFKHPEGHQNPRRAIDPQKFQAGQVRLGAFRLSEAQIAKFGGLTPVKDLPPPRAGQHAIPGGYYVGQSPTSPAVGDLRITFQAAPPGEVSILYRQSGDTFAPFLLPHGSTADALEMGDVGKEEMVAHLESENTVMAWILRGVGFVLLAVGISLVFRPLSVAADVIPFVGNVVGMGTGCAAIGLALVGAVLTIGVAWVAYRPLLGIPLLVLGGGALIAMMVLGGKAKRRKKASS